MGRGIYILLVFSVIVSAWATSAVALKGRIEVPCGVGKITLAVEVCPPNDVKATLGEVESGVRQQLHDQTLVDFVLIASYVGLWGATAVALHPGVALVAAAAGAADVVENLAILHELPRPDPLPLVQWAGLTKWGLLGIVFLSFVLLFRPHRVSGRWASLLRAATGLAYGVAGVMCLCGLVNPRFVEWAAFPIVVAVFLQLVLHVVAHGEFEALGNSRAASREPSEGSLSVERVLTEEYECLHGPLNGPGGLGWLYEAIHGLRERRAALCLSGGGIRSATFALGVLQGLAKVKVLPQFHYLSTVSGGGYIGGWLTAWLHHSRDDVAAVADSLATLDSSDKLDPEPPPVSHLRDYSNYLAPRSGLLSADTWSLAGTILRNLILLWVVLLPLLAAGLIVPRLYLALILGGRASNILLGLGTIALAWAVAYLGASIPSSTTARRGQGKFLTLGLAPLLIAMLCLTLYWAWSPTFEWKHFVYFGVVVHLLAWAGYTLWLMTPWGAARPWTGSRAQKIGAALSELGVVVIAGAAAGFLAWCLAYLLFNDHGRLGRFTLLYACIAPSVFLGAFLLAATLLVGLLSRWTNDEDREWWARCGAWTLISGVAWMLLSSLVLFGPLLFSRPVVTWLLASVGGTSGLIALAGGWSARSAAGSASAPPGLASKLGGLGLPAAAAVFAAVLLLAMSLFTSGLLRWLMDRAPELALSGSFPTPWPDVPQVPLDHVKVLLSSSPVLVVMVGAGLALLGSATAWLINTNKFSLHAMYRARLIRAYLGASNLERDSNPFTGFDEADNIQMHELWPNPPPSAPAPSRQPGRKALFHVVNVALNLVHGDRLAWQERKAHSFTVSPLHAGSVAVGHDEGYRRTRSRSDTPPRYYGGPRGVSLGTAITISGAAASPNMGYHSSPLVTFLMTFFNARLGWWLGNPGRAGDNTFYLSSPRFTVRPIVAEAFGLTDSTSPYVYLSDGGHFDNLGLYEMVLRRCHFIVVSDAGCDATCGLNDLGGAIRKIRADLGIPIDFPNGISIYPRSADPVTRARGLYWAVGRIRYSVVDPPPTLADPAAAAAALDARDGWLLYVKPAFYGSEPPDIYQYAMANDQFPHESTVDQFFGESQFESYRMLGVHAIARLCDGWTPGPLADLVRHATTARGTRRALEG